MRCPGRPRSRAFPLIYDTQTKTLIHAGLSQLQIIYRFKSKCFRDFSTHPSPAVSRTAIIEWLLPLCTQKGKGNPACSRHRYIIVNCGQANGMYLTFHKANDDVEVFIDQTMLLPYSKLLCIELDKTSIWGLFVDTGAAHYAGFT